GLERTLHALAARNLAHGEGRVEAAVALPDDHAFVRLHALALAFDDAHVDDDGVARREVGDGLAQAGDLFVFELLDDVHRISLSWRTAQGRNHAQALMC